MHPLWAFNADFDPVTDGGAPALKAPAQARLLHLMLSSTTSVAGIWASIVCHGWTGDRAAY